MIAGILAGVGTVAALWVLLDFIAAAGLTPYEDQTTQPAPDDDDDDDNERKVD